MPYCWRFVKRMEGYLGESNYYNHTGRVSGELVHARQLGKLQYFSLILFFTFLASFSTASAFLTISSDNILASILSTESFSSAESWNSLVVSRLICSWRSCCHFMARSLSCYSVVTTGTRPASGPWLTNGGRWIWPCATARLAVPIQTAPIANSDLKNINTSMNECIPITCSPTHTKSLQRLPQFPAQNFAGSGLRHCVYKAYLSRLLVRRKSFGNESAKFFFQSSS